jgi:hypothetical protein
MRGVKAVMGKLQATLYVAEGLFDGVCNPNTSLALVAVDGLLAFPVLWGFEDLESLESKSILSLE